MAIGGNAIALKLPKQPNLVGIDRIRLIRKACYFDGLLNGRIEILFRVDASVLNRETTSATIRYLLDLSMQIKNVSFDGKFKDGSSSLARLWCVSTTRHGVRERFDLVKAGNPVCFVESDTKMEPYKYNEADHPEYFDVYTVEHSKREPDGSKTIINSEKHYTPKFPYAEVALLEGKPAVEVLYLWTVTSIAEEKTFFDRQDLAFYRQRLRYLRTYLFRLMQNIEALSLLFGMPKVNLSDDVIQNLLNEYTRQISRSRQRLEKYPEAAIIGYCYRAFNRLYPGSIDALRTEIQVSSIRPNVAKKILALLDISELNNLHIAGDFNWEKIMGPKYENIEVTGSQGVAIGNSAKATVENSSNSSQLNQSVQLSEELARFADSVRSRTDMPDFELEATLVDLAATKAKSGDEPGAAAILKKCATWVLDLTKSVGGTVIGSFVKAHLGLS